MAHPSFTVAPMIGLLLLVITIEIAVVIAALWNILDEIREGLL